MFLSNLAIKREAKFFMTPFFGKNILGSCLTNAVKTGTQSYKFFQIWNFKKCSFFIGTPCIKNYRPISLIIVDSKILTRTLATRMAKVLHKLIHRNQTCVPGRCICNNTHIIQDLIDVINMEGIGGALILLDQEKAFDRMSHSFIVKVLRKFGFGERFIK